MFLSLNWLKKHVNISRKHTPEQIGELLTLHTAEVEEIKNPAQGMTGVIVAQVLSVEKHPNADRLVVAKLTDGKNEYQVVCGGTNVRSEMLVPLAKIGAKVKWHGEEDLVELKETEIRGVKSFGMICSPQEIGLERQFLVGEKEILDLTPFNLKVGLNLGEALGLDDAVYEIENKTITHRPDLWSHSGFARELAALTGAKLEESSPKKQNGAFQNKVSVEIKNKQACPRYLAVKIDKIEIAESPLWLKTAMAVTGNRSINNIVDLTNFVMFDLGQPLHAFDAKKLAGEKIIVRQAQKGEMMELLDGSEAKLEDSDLLICDAQKPVALAGIMGGGNSEIDENTTSIVLEAANFDAQTIRRTSMRLGLRTEASMRFEKSQDPNLAESGMLRFLELLKEVSPRAQVVSSITDVKSFKESDLKIKLDLDYINKKSGIDFTPAAVKSSLKPLGFAVSGSGKNLIVTVPTWRSGGDVSMPDDIVEELTRLYGFDNIKPVLPAMQMKAPNQNEELALITKIKQFLSLGAGMNEVLNYSFVGEHQVKNPQDHLALKNPVNKEESLLRQSLIPGLRKNAENNLRFFDEFRLFEVGSVYFKNAGFLPADASGKTKLPRQEKRVAGVLVGEEKDLFLRAKGVFQTLITTLGFEYNEKLVNFETELNFDKPAVFFEINFSELLLQKRRAKTFAGLPKFPGVERDLAFLVSQKITYRQIEQTINSAGAEFLVAFQLFDVYQGKGTGVNEKSFAFHLVFRAPDRTLAATEADKDLGKIIKALEKEVGAKTRK